MAGTSAARTTHPLGRKIKSFYVNIYQGKKLPKMGEAVKM